MTELQGCSSRISLQEERELGPVMHDERDHVQGIRGLHFTFQFTL